MSDLDLAADFMKQLALAQSQNQSAPGANLVSFKPIESIAMAVHPKQVNEARELAKRKGVPVEFKPNGSPVFTSSRQFRAYARAHGFVHKGYA